ncbi:uncharacterized protein LOC5504030 [Nematostella vectensis]|nr:uncharacterized protein LOC5504030 [Nematostella vectensis]
MSVVWNFLRRIARRERGKSRMHGKISTPTNFQHRVHVIVDKDTGQFIGLPPQWIAIMNTKTRQPARRTMSSPELRSHPVMRKQNGGLKSGASNGGVKNNSAEAIMEALQTPGSRSSIANDQDIVIERLKRELQDYREKSPDEFDTPISNLDSSDNRNDSHTVFQRKETTFSADEDDDDNAHEEDHRKAVKVRAESAV